MIRNFFRSESYQAAMDRRSHLDYIALNELFELQKGGVNVDSKLREIKEVLYTLQVFYGSANTQ